ncbi:hypothetical protein E1D38_09880, partial [Campylobacter jejuni]|nr:hypothetical protein [Campylobacter jejuni]
KLKEKLESKGIDNISSGQIAWCLGSGYIALICAVFVVIYKLKNLEFELYIVFFFPILLFYIAIFWFIFLSFYKNFFFIHLFCYCFMYIFNIIFNDFYLNLAIINILLMIIWFFFVKLHLKFKFLFLMMYFCFEIAIFIGIIPYGLLEGTISK